MKIVRKHKIVTLMIILILVIFFLYDQNNGITVTNILVESDRIPKEFHGYRILQISDLHSKYFGKNQEKLIKKVINEAPDLIVITGDSVDSKHYDEDATISLFPEINKVAPVYFVTGNHEAWSGKFIEYEKRLNDNKVNVLRNEKININNGDSSIQIIGIDDPDMLTYDNIEVALEELNGHSNEYYSLLLSHRPELIETYSERDIDLVFSGHAHGGQFRLPFVGGVVAPNQGWFPEYSSGLYQLGRTKMIVSRGLGNSLISQRLFNKPELIVVTLNNNE